MFDEKAHVPQEKAHALITGASRGIGEAIARRLQATGARITLLGRDEARLRGLARELGGDTGWQVADVSREAEVVEAFSSAERTAGPITVLVNNAGQAASATVSGTGLDLWERMLAVNLTGTFLCSRAVLPGMLAAGRGRIVNIASTAGLRGYAYVAAYAAAKHGVVGFTRSLALELAGKGITVNAVCPGYTETDLIRESIRNVVAKTGRSEEQARSEFTASNPQGRLVQPWEVAEAVAWLCSDAAAAVTGQALAVAGGEVMA